MNKKKERMKQNFLFKAIYIKNTAMFFNTIFVLQIYLIMILRILYFIN